MNPITALLTFLSQTEPTAMTAKDIRDKYLADLKDQGTKGDAVTQAQAALDTAKGAKQLSDRSLAASTPFFAELLHDQPRAMLTDYSLTPPVTYYTADGFTVESYSVPDLASIVVPEQPPATDPANSARPPVFS